MAFSKVVKFGSKVMKVVTDFQDTVKSEKENLDATKTAVDEVGDVRDEGRNPFHSTMRKLTRKKRKGHLNFSPIPQPETENKEEVYEWIYNECTNILSQLRENIKETCEHNPQYRRIKFRIYDDMLIFHVPNDLGDDWGYFKDYVQLESFALQSRLDKVNKYNFDHEDLKRITEAKEKVKSLCHPPSNFSLANRFYKTDKLLAAYFSRQSLIKLLSIFTTEEEYEKIMVTNSQKQIDLNKT